MPGFAEGLVDSECIQGLLRVPKVCAARDVNPLALCGACLHQRGSNIVLQVGAQLVGLILRMLYSKPLDLHLGLMGDVAIKHNPDAFMRPGR